MRAYDVRCSVFVPYLQSIGKSAVIVQQGRRFMLFPKAQETNAINLFLAVLNGLNGERQAREFTDHIVKAPVQRMESLWRLALNRLFLFCKILLQHLGVLWVPNGAGPPDHFEFNRQPNETSVGNLLH